MTTEARLAVLPAVLPTLLEEPSARDVVTIVSQHSRVDWDNDFLHYSFDGDVLAK